MANHHDIGYKTLFAHPELVRDLVAGFTPFRWLEGLDAVAFERVNPAYVSERLSERQDDIVWRVRLGEQWLYVYILLEFQSGVDRWMALRMQVYIGLLYQDLVRRGELGGDGKLPPVLPLVFYNGRARWNASMELAGMIAPAPDGIAQLQASQRYFLIDQRRLDCAELSRQRSILSLLFRMELSDTDGVIEESISVLITWLGEDDQTQLRRDVKAWLDRLLNREFKVQVQGDGPEPEGTDMGERKFDTWADMYEDRGRQRGLQQGLQQGLEQGRAEAREREAASLRRILENILAKRSMVLPEASAARMAAAQAEELQEWIDRALETDSAEAWSGPGTRYARPASGPDPACLI